MAIPETLTCVFVTGKEESKGRFAFSREVVEEKGFSIQDVFTTDQRSMARMPSTADVLVVVDEFAERETAIRMLQARCRSRVTVILDMGVFDSAPGIEGVQFLHAPISEEELGSILDGLKSQSATV